MNITIPIEEYKELLIIKGKYEEITKPIIWKKTIIDGSRVPMEYTKTSC